MTEVVQAIVMATAARFIVDSIGKQVRLKGEKSRKFRENLWYLVWHSYSFVSNLRLSAGWALPLILRLGVDELDGGMDAMALEERRFLTRSLGFWCSCAVFLCFFERKRKDYIQMLVHHIATIVLVWAALHLNEWKFGSFILLLHDVVDVFLYAAKTAVQFDEIRWVADLLFAVFAVSFFVARLIVFPLCAVWSSWWWAGRRGGGVIYLLSSFLTVLFGLHCFWFSLIIRVVKKMKQGANAEDIRSDDE
jgi:hypothetical protein